MLYVKFSLILSCGEIFLLEFWLVEFDFLEFGVLRWIDFVLVVNYPFI